MIYINKFKIDLNLLISYPVKWDKFKILRDFIQNFYDSVPREEFNKRFSWHHEDNTLTLLCENVSFNYKWLVHIGGSTKRDDETKKSAGYFGEGFKIACLCALRDCNWNIKTSSSDWELNVLTTDIIIDNKNVQTLSYEICTDLMLNKNTSLTIDNFSENDIEIFICALNSFFYKENPLIGDTIFENYICGIYHRSAIDKPADFPKTYELKGDGIVFAAFQALGSLDIPIVISYNDFVNDDRDRNFFSKIDVINILIKCIYQTDSKTAFLLINMFDKYWYTYPSEKYGYNSYYSVIKNLIFNFSRDTKYYNKFRSLNPNLLTADKIQTSDFAKNNNRTFALAWLENNPQYRLVQDSFRFLGYKSLEEMCELNNALPLVRFPTEKEQQYIFILEFTAKKVLESFLPFDTFPIYKVIENKNSSANGYVEMVKLKKTIKTPYNFRCKLKINAICLKHDILNRDSFSTAFGTFIHELCHCFGGDKSAAFSYALTAALDIVVKNCDVISESIKLWNEI